MWSPHSESKEKSPKLETTSATASTVSTQSVVSDVKKKIDGMKELIDGMTKIYNDINTMESDIVTMNDLLTVFQGAVPINGCIIIAMTNKFDELKKRCLALFRAGRLTPLYFDNFNLEMINRVSQHYFGRNIRYEGTPEMTLQPSKVIDELFQSKMSWFDLAQFEQFSRRINEMLTTTTSCQ